MILFSSWQYVIFLTVVTSLYWISSRNIQNLILLSASLLFYGSWDWRFLFLLLFSTNIDFYAAKAIYGSSDPGKRKAFLVLSVGANLVILGFFKYFNFFISNLDSLLKPFHVNVGSLHLSIILPIGISFYTFQAISYVIDIYRRDIEPESKWSHYVLYIIFFPQLVAGPIERAKHLLTQINSKRKFAAQGFFYGIDLILWGLLKKIVIADGIAYYVNNIFALRDPSTLLMIVGSFAYGVQIFSDFSGYSDIARGSAKLLGFEIMKNFDGPYGARNPSEFWRKWHISLSSFVRDYVYIPLGGDRCSGARYLFNVFVTWFLMGLWHGAAWHYVLWGLFHGALVVAHKFFIRRVIFLKNMNSSFFSFASILTTYFLVNAGWLLFKIGSLSELKMVFSRAAFHASFSDLKVSYIIFLIVIFYSLPYLVFYFLRGASARLGISFASFGSLRIIYYTAALLCMMVFGGLNNDFIYFQF